MGSAVFVVLNVGGFDNQGRREGMQLEGQARGQNDTQHMIAHRVEKQHVVNFRAKLAAIEPLQEPVSLTDGLVEPAKRLMA
jgi:hypothetical protein